MRLGVVAGTNLSADYGSETLQINADVIDRLGSFHEVSRTIKSGPKSLLVGPSIEFLLPRRLSVETDVIYRPVSTTNIAIYDTRAPRDRTTVLLLGSFRCSRSIAWVTKGLCPLSVPDRTFG